MTENDAIRERLDKLEDVNTRMAKEFGVMLMDFGEINETMKRVANVNIQLMRGLKELDERTEHLKVVEA